MEADNIFVGDCLDVMAGMPDGCVVVTDPQYYNERNYRCR